MNNKVFYGEYTLKHWIDMMLSGNIVLPDYQRHFVWRERDVKRLIQSLKDGQFVQPVTIALYNDEAKKENLILDGQQRLTSLLLAYLGYFPDKKKFERGDMDTVAREDDSALDNLFLDDEQTAKDDFLWQYTVLLPNGNTKDQIVAKISRDDRYIPMEDELLTQLNDAFFQKTYLGFSYVVPESNNVADIQKSFSQMFRNINYFGKKLEPMDSRKSLYYQNADLTKYFEGKCSDGTDVFGDLRIMEDLQPSKIDFVRYLAILSQYAVSHREFAKDVMVGYSAYSSRESFYADYVSYILGIEQEDRLNKFDSFDFAQYFPNASWKERFVSLRNAIAQVKTCMDIKDGNLFSSWFEADFWLFGLMYHILFKGKTLNSQFYSMRYGKRVYLKNEINEAIENLKNDPAFLKNSNRLSYIRERLIKSCEIYSAYVH